jgi:hypothetical protein
MAVKRHINIFNTAKTLTGSYVAGDNDIDARDADDLYLLLAYTKNTDDGVLVKVEALDAADLFVEMQADPDFAGGVVNIAPVAYKVATTGKYMLPLALIGHTLRFSINTVTPGGTPGTVDRLVAVAVETAT